MIKSIKNLKLINSVLFLFFIIISFFCYRYFIDSGDAMMYCRPNKASNVFQFIYYSARIWMIHNVSQGFMWSIPFSISQLFSSGNLFKMPWWLCIGMLHFCLVSSSVNISFFFKKIFKFDRLSFILTLCFFIGGYSLNLSYLHYSFFLGDGMYPVAIFLFTLYMLVLINERDLYITKLILFVFLINLNDIIKMPALFFLIWADYYAHRIDIANIKSFLVSNIKRFIIPFLLFCLNVLLSLRAVQSSVIKNFSNVVEFSLHSTIKRIFLYFDRLENICYESFLKAFNLSGFVEHTSVLQLACILLFVVFLCSVLTLWYQKKKDILKANQVLIGLFGLTFMSLYCSNVRAFISEYHGHYADDNFMFLFVLFVYVLLYFVFSLLKFNKERLFYYKIALIIYCLLFSIIPSLVSAYDIAVFRNNQSLRNRNFEKDFLKALDNQTPETIPTVAYKLKEYPDKLLHCPNALYWMPYWQNKKANNYIVGNPADKNFREIYSYNPAFIPFDLLFLKRKTPVLIRENFFWGEAVRDYYIPKELIGKDLDLSIYYNDNFAGSPLHKSVYTYRLKFSAAAGMDQLNANLISKSLAYSFEQTPDVTFMRYRGTPYNVLLFTLLDKYDIPYNTKRFTPNHVTERDYLDIVWSLINKDYLNDSYRKLEGLIGNDNGDKLKEYLENDKLFFKTFYLLATETKRSHTKFILRVSVKGGAPSYTRNSSKLTWHNR